MAQGEDGQVYTSIVQHGCDRIEMAVKSYYLGELSAENHTFRLDGIERADSRGSERYRSSARFVGCELRVTITDSRTTHTEIYSLNPAGDLVEWTPAPDPIKVVARCQK